MVAPQSTVYYARYARERIAEAQRTLDAHVTSAWTGCCQRCGRTGPCPDRSEAEQTLAGYWWLPKRLPGASLDDSPFQHQDGFDWFSDPVPTR